MRVGCLFLGHLESKFLFQDWLDLGCLDHKARTAITESQGLRMLVLSDYVRWMRCKSNPPRRSGGLYEQQEGQNGHGRDRGRYRRVALLVHHPDNSQYYINNNLIRRSVTRNYAAISLLKTIEFSLTDFWSPGISAQRQGLVGINAGQCFANMHHHCTFIVPRHNPGAKSSLTPQTSST